MGQLAKLATRVCIHSAHLRLCLWRARWGWLKRKPLADEAALAVAQLGRTGTTCPQMAGSFV